MFQAGEKGILEIGKAGLGDKTLLVTIAPAVRALEDSQREGKTLTEALSAFEQAAKSRMESTKDMKATMGRASRLGDRTIGHQDAGATSCYFIRHALASAVEEDLNE